MPFYTCFVTSSLMTPVQSSLFELIKTFETEDDAYRYLSRYLEKSTSLLFAIWSQLKSESQFEDNPPGEIVQLYRKEFENFDEHYYPSISYEQFIQKFPYISNDLVKIMNSYNSMFMEGKKFGVIRS